MEGFKYEDINKETLSPIEDDEKFEAEKHLENIENFKNFVDEEKEVITNSHEGNEKESRIKTTFKKVIIGATIMISLWSMGKMNSSKVEASEDNTQVGQQDNQENSLISFADEGLKITRESEGSMADVETLFSLMDEIKRQMEECEEREKSGEPFTDEEISEQVEKQNEILKKIEE